MPTAFVCQLTRAAATRSLPVSNAEQDYREGRGLPHRVSSQEGYGRTATTFTELNNPRAEPSGMDVHNRQFRQLRRKQQYTEEQNDFIAHCNAAAGTHARHYFLCS